MIDAVNDEGRGADVAAQAFCRQAGDVAPRPRHDHDEFFAPQTAGEVRWTHVSREPSATRVRAARIVAVAADAVQIAAAPLFGEGFASPFNDALDVVVAIVLIRLLGFHWVLLPALAAEALPAVDLAPTWTAAVLMITGFPGKRWLIALAWVATAIAAVLLAWHFR